MPVGLSLILALFLFGCTQAPTPPTLGRGNHTQSVPKILSSRLEPGDYRRIFESINRDGKLDSLKGYFERPSDDELSEIGEVLSRHLYENEELLNLVSERVRRRSFREPFALNSHRAILRDVLRSTEFPALAEQARGIATEEWRSAVRKIRKAGNDFPGTSEPLEGNALVDDLRTFFDSPLRPKAEKLWETWRDYGMGSSALWTFSTLREAPDHSAFRGLGVGLAELLGDGTRPNSLHQLLELVHQADGPTDGIFGAISKKFMTEPDLIHEIANRFRPIVTRAAIGFTQEILDEGRARAFWAAVPKKGKEFAQVFITFRTALERVAGPAQDFSVEEEALLQNLRLYTNAYALTKWMEGAVAANTKAFASDKAFWDIPIVHQGLSLDLKSEETLKEMKAIGLGEFAGILEKAKDVPLGNFFYDFPAFAEPLTLRSALRDAMENAASTRAFADPSSFIRALVYPFTRPEAHSVFAFSDLENDNLMTSINRLLAAFSLDTTRKMKKTIFEDLEFTQIANPEFDLRKLILGFYPTDPLQTRVTSLLDRLPSFYEFDREWENLPSPFSTYHALLRHTPAVVMPALTSLLSFLGEGELATQKYPFIFDAIHRKVPVARATASLSVLNVRERENFLAPLGEIEPAPTLDLLSRLVRENSSGLNEIAHSFLHGELWDQIPALQESEWKWIEELLDGQDLRKVWNFVSRYGSRESSLQLVHELQTLTRSGYLKEAVALLYQFQNERLQRFARVWLDWNSSGEWLEFLNKLEHFLQ